MFDFIKTLFNKTPKYSLGAYQNVPDVRNIDIASFQKPVLLPEDFETIMTSVRDQGGTAKCVASAICEVGELYLSKNEINAELLDDDLYNKCKAIDGIPELPGTFPKIGASIACNEGILSLNNTRYKLGGYAFVENDFASICQSIYQNGAVCASLEVDSNWFIGKIMKVLRSIGRHYVVLNGFNTSKKIFKGQNSWGINWVGYIAGIFNNNVKQGHFEVLYEDIENSIIDIIVFANIPKDIIDKAKGIKYLFLRDLRIGMFGEDVGKLQERLMELGIFTNYNITNYFGTYTKQCLMQYQKKNNLPATGFFGPMTRQIINEIKMSKPTSKIDLWCQAIEKMEGSKKELNNPGNIKYIGQSKAIGKDYRGFCIFPDYATGYMELRNLLVRAASGKSKIYSPNMNLIEFYNLYAPSSDNNDPNSYAQFVAKYVGVPVETPISALL